MSQPALPAKTSFTKFSETEIRALLKSARLVLANNAIKIKRAPAAQLPGRLLIIIPRKVGNAPARNKLRRQLKALFYQNKLHTNLFDVVIMAYPPIAEASFAQLQEWFKILSA
jgi:ribonuclease P protein component